MFFDPQLEQSIRELHASTWYIHQRCVQITHPRPFVLQGVRAIPGPDLSGARGVTWVSGPGPYAGELLTILRAPSIAALTRERQRLETYLGEGWTVEAMELQAAAVSAALRGSIEESERPDGSQDLAIPVAV